MSVGWVSFDVFVFSCCVFPDAIIESGGLQRRASRSDGSFGFLCETGVSDGWKTIYEFNVIYVRSEGMLMITRSSCDAYFGMSELQDLKEKQSVGGVSFQSNRRTCYPDTNTKNTILINFWERKGAIYIFLPLNGFAQ